MFRDVLITAFGLTDEDAAAIFPDSAAAETVTRKDAALYLKRMLDRLGVVLPAGEPIEFSDLDGVSAEEAAAIAALQQGNIINGVGHGLYAPDSATTRAQLAALVSRLLPTMAVEEAAA